MESICLNRSMSKKKAVRLSASKTGFREHESEWEEGKFKASFIKEIKRREKSPKLIPAEEVFKELW